MQALARAEQSAVVELSEHTVIDRFREQASKTPAAPALIERRAATSYRELDRRSDSIAAYLTGRCGLRPEEPVVVLADRGRDTVAALLGVMKAGGVYVPVDTGYPAERVRLMLDDTRCRIVIDAAGAGGMRIDAEHLLPMRELAASLPFRGRGPAQSDLAYINYTSGSNGRPKGVLIEHRGLTNIVLDHVALFDVGPADRVVHFSSPAWDAAMFQVFVPLVCGASVVLVPRDVIDDPLRLLGYLDETRSTVLSFPPAYLHTLGRARFPFARVLNTGGDASVVDDALFHARHLRYIGTYGPTETTICAAYHEVDPSQAYPHGVPIGRGARNVRIDVLDSALEPVPDGEVGEICIGGPGVARGYLGQPELTAERFVADPRRAGERLYRSGDLGRRRPDGQIEFAGRKDRQVKVRGFRVEPGEIEARLEHHPGVGRAVVVARGAAAADRELVAYTFGRAPVDPSELRAHLLSTLPEAIVPTRFVWMPEAPLTAHGKIDHARLLPPEPQTRTAEPSPDGDEIELRIAGIWAEVLGLGAAGINDDFFEIGGHSLAAAQIVARLRAAGLPAEPSDVITARTPARLAQLVRRPGAALLPPIAPAAPAERYPASHAQARLWFLSQIDGASAEYNVPVGHVIDGPLDAAALDRALCDVVARHESLRTNLVTVDGAPWQAVREAPRSVLEVVGATDAGERARLEAQRPFDLAADLLIRAVLVRTAPRQHVLLITVHHAVCDGWSMGRLLADLEASYSRRVGRGGVLPALALQYRDFSAWQRALLDGPEGERRARWWKETLAATPQLPLPADRPRPAARTTDGTTRCSAIDRRLLDAVRALGREHGVSLFMVLVAAVDIVLHRYTGADDIVVGAPIINRPLPELEEQIGFYVETVPLRVAIDADLTVRALLQNVKRACLDAIDHIYPFDALVDLAGVERDPGRSPLFDVMVALQQKHELDLALDGLGVRQFAPSFAGSKFDLSVDFVEGESELEMRVEYRTDLFDADRIERLERHIECVLRAMTGDPLARVGDVAIMPADEMRLVTGSFASSGVDFPAGETLVDLFDASAAAAPERVAVVCGGRTLTYAQLAARADELAAHLASLGIGRGDLVGVLLRRSERCLAALLAIWKAGAGHLPLDPEHPPERLRALVASAGCRAVVAESRTAPAIGDAAAVIFADRPASPPAAALPRVTPQDVAYCIFTSGSTGEPKGVVVSHASAVNAAAMWRRSYALDRPVILQLANFVFDVSLGDVCRSLLAGGTAVVATEEERLDPAAIVDLVERHGVTMFETTPSVARLLAEEIGRRGDAMPSLELLVVGSEPWLRTDYERLRAVVNRRTRLINSYGTTETTVDSAFFDADRDGAVRDSDLSVPIGRPMDSVEVLICDERLAPVPIGVTGEMCIAGPGVADGYLRAPELTARKFVPHPLRPGERMYRTGDRAAWRGDGIIVLAGRADDQIKLRGHRIEPAEVETALVRCAGVRSAAVVLAGEQLIAAVVAADDASEEAIRAEAARLLPPYMVPARVHRLPAIPLTASGKVDRRALLAAMPAHGDAPAAAAAPETPTERVLAEVWRDVLAVDVVPADVSFFALGGDSIRIVQVVQRCRDRGLPMRVVDALQHVTIAELARFLDGPRAAAGKDAIPMHLVARSPAAAALLGPGDEDVYPASRMQRMMLRLTERYPGSGLYHGQTTWEIEDDHLSVDRWVRAIEWSVRRAPAMRTVFRRDGAGEVQQIVRPASSIAVAVEDLTALAPPAQDAHIREVAAADLRDPFLIDGERPFCRIRLFVRSRSRLALFLSIHHALDDGWGASQLENEWLAAVGALRRGEALPPPPRVNSFKELIALEREIESSAEARAFWDGELSALAASLAPHANAAPPSIALHSLSLPGEAARRLAARARQTGASLKAVCLARFLPVAASAFAADGAECVVGVVSNGRSERLSDPLGALGLFWNIVPLRVALASNGGSESAVHDALRWIEPHARYPIPRVVAADAPWPPVCFNFIRRHGEAAPDGDGGVRILDRRIVDRFHYPLTCAVVIGRDDEAIDLHLQHDRRFLSDEDAAAIAERYRQSLSGVEGAGR